MFKIPRRRKILAPSVAGLAVAATLLIPCAGVASAAGPGLAAGAAASSHSGPVKPGQNEKVIGLYTEMHDLWSDHMQWTYTTVDAFFHNQPELHPALDRLLRNQRDIGAAIVPYYGQAAGDQLTALLTTHIEQAVPVLQAAQAGDQPALKKALDDWYANAKDIADFLSDANPKNWPRSVTEPMLSQHIDQTVVYATDLLKGRYTNAVKHFDKANDHMMMLADVLARGIVAQFPDKFCDEHNGHHGSRRP
ncbi:hypothetical protein [Streptomyces sp. NPDC005485]|uniref:hypothetical protein n=1 Tax=Streptomyces sp. NPDC005485 TaxID=3155591 RepID=UPI0033B2DBD5